MKVKTYMIAVYEMCIRDSIALHDRGRYTQTEPTEAYIKLTRLEGIVVSVLCAVLLVVLLFAPK